MTFFIDAPTETEKKADLVIKLWNKYAKLNGFSVIRSTQNRRIFVQRAIRCGFTYKDLRDGIRMLQKCKHLSSEKWFNFDWLFKNDTNLSKFLEGKYVNCFKTIQYSGASNVNSTVLSF